MLETLIYASGDIVLLVGALIMFAFRLFNKDNPRLYFLLTKIFLIIALFFVIRSFYAMRIPSEKK